MLKCRDCYAYTNDEATVCKMCGSRSLTSVAAVEEQYLEKMNEEVALKQETMDRANKMKVFTVLEPRSIVIKEELGLVFGNSSKQAFWGLSTQANRLSRAYEAALINLKYDAAVIGADAVIGISFALNNSTGSSATLLTGSSEAVMLLGTAVKTQ